MNSLQQQRLAAFIDTVANLKAQYCELNELRERVRKKLLSARKPSQPKHRNRHDAISRSSLETDRESAFRRTEALSDLNAPQPPVEPISPSALPDAVHAK
jgi:hypothetical protein